MFTLFHHSFCPHSRFIRLALGEHGLDLRLVEERVWERREAFLALNPAATTPVLIADDQSAIPGAAIIAEYLDETRGAGMGDRRLLPAAMNERIESFVAKHTFADYIYLAQGPFFPVVREAALKVTEMSCSYAQPYHTLEFRHGPKSIVAPETCLTFFLSDAAMQAESEVLVEMKQLGGTIVAICNRAPDSIRSSVDLLIEFEANVPELALMAPFLVPAQLLGFHTGVKKGFNPDEPKNLSRVVILD